MPHGKYIGKLCLVIGKIYLSRQANLYSDEMRKPADQERGYSGYC